MKQSLQLNFRITEDIRQCFDEIEKRTGQKDYVIARSLFHALVEHWDKNKSITLPFVLSDNSASAKK
jgi:hypothetical protein